MSFLVELDRSAYPDDALVGFAVTSQFGLDNARVMMWLSQLAYETAHPDKIDSILKAWGLARRALASDDPITGWPPHSACVVVAGGRGATFVSFSGTDPIKAEDWITDLTAVPSPTSLHTGFQDAVEKVWPTIRSAIANRATPEQALFLTGHSLGGALTIIAAERAMRELGVQATAVYTFGGPRTGGDAFFNAYTPALGNSTFRLIHGADVVPTVPTSLLGGYRHVGRALQCPSDGLFQQDGLMAPDENKPDLAQSALQSGIADIHAFAAARLIAGIGPRPLDQLAGVLPRMIRDHIPTNYFRALGITV